MGSTVLTPRTVLFLETTITGLVFHISGNTASAQNRHQKSCRTLGAWLMVGPTNAGLERLLSMELF
ncbi:MAG: hypothetical protein AAGL49_05285, partial [Pseudomonadota bacterium]